MPQMALDGMFEAHNHRYCTARAVRAIVAVLSSQEMSPSHHPHDSCIIHDPHRNWTRIRLMLCRPLGTHLSQIIIVTKATLTDCLTFVTHLSWARLTSLVWFSPGFTLATVKLINSNV